MLTRIARNEKGMATFETIPLIVIFVMLVGYSLGLYGAIHTATLSSIGARAYAFETFRNRADLTYYRDRRSNAPILHFDKKGFRYHAINVREGADFYAPRRPITIGKQPTNTSLSNQNTTNRSVHDEDIYRINARNEDVSLSHIWIMVGYGMCMNPACGAPEP